MLACQWVWQRTKSVSIPAEEQNAGRVVDYFYRMEFHTTPRFFSDSNYLFFFEIFEKSADFATKFGWGISATKGSPLWKKNEIDQKRYPNISVFFGFHFVFFGFSGTRGNFPLRKKKKKRNGPNYTELDRTVRVPPIHTIFFWPQYPQTTRFSVPANFWSTNYREKCRFLGCRPHISLVKTKAL